MAGGEVVLRTGARVAITTDTTIEGTAERISTTYAALPRDVKPGDRILLDDGNLELSVLDLGADRIDCQVVDGGPLRSNKGMNLPGVVALDPGAHRKGPQRPRVRTRERGRLRRTLLRAPGP